MLCSFSNFLTQVTSLAPVRGPKNMKLPAQIRKRGDFLMPEGTTLSNRPNLPLIPGHGGLAHGWPRDQSDRFPLGLQSIHVHSGLHTSHTPALEVPEVDDDFTIQDEFVDIVRVSLSPKESLVQRGIHPAQRNGYNQVYR